MRYTRTGPVTRKPHTHKGKIHFVIVYNLTRFAREKYDHFALRAHLKSLGTDPPAFRDVFSMILRTNPVHAQVVPSLYGYM